MSRRLSLLSLTAFALSSPAVADAPRVAADIAPIHALVARVMEGVGTPDLILPPGASPHEYSLRPSEAAALQAADLVVWVGPDLTPWMAGALESLAADASVTALLDVDGTRVLPFREGALFEAHSHGDEHDHDEHEEHDAGHADDAAHEHDHENHAADAVKAAEHDHDHDHAGHDHDKDEEHADHAGHDHDTHDAHEDHADHGHAHDGRDPHAWLSPDNAAVWLDAIAGALGAVDPANAADYAANAAAARAEMVALKQEIAGILEPVRGRNFIVFHDAYQYFETAFDMPASGAISLSDASDPSPARIAEIQARVAEQGVTCVLSEPQFAPGLIAAVMDGSAARTGVLDPVGVGLTPGATLYPDLLRGLATTLAECL